MKVLCFFTNYYPYGDSETFIENELIYLANNYQEIYLFHFHKTESHRPIPKNVKLIYLNELPRVTKIKTLSGNWNTFIKIVLVELFYSRQKKLFLKGIKYNLSFLIDSIFYSNVLKVFIDKYQLDHALFYSYWFYNANLSLSILKYNKRINKVVTRAHGFDLYEYNGKLNYLPFRKFCLENTDKVFVVSDLGRKYLSNLYPKYTNKIITSYLGTRDYGVNPMLKDGLSLHIVSCSNVCEVKRIHLIIEILKHVSVPIKWTHIGDGVLLQSIKKMAENLPKNVVVNMLGRLSQQEIFNYYVTEPINFFINTSISEGLPVSIMEAISFGIPVIATSAGGTSEIVNEITGLLIDVDFNVEKVANYISTKKIDEFSRRNIKIYWKNNYSADVNYYLFNKYINETY